MTMSAQMMDAMLPQDALLLRCLAMTLILALSTLAIELQDVCSLKSLATTTMFAPLTAAIRTLAIVPSQRTRFRRVTSARMSIVILRWASSQLRSVVLPLAAAAILTADVPIVLKACLRQLWLVSLLVSLLL